MEEEFRYEVDGSELRQHFTERYAHHKERAAHYLKKAEEQALKIDEQLGAANTVTDRISIKNSSNFRHDENDRDKYSNAAASHQRTSKLFEWRFNHVSPDKRYYLTDSEIAHLELIS